MPGIKPQEKVKREWSPELAYCVGLLTADGCLSKDGRHLNLTSKDYGQIKTFKKCLGLKNRVSKKGRSTTKIKKYFYVQFGGVIFYRWLVHLGLTPKKSNTIGQLKIPDDFFFDFLRGYFDGDGTIYSYWSPQWKTSYVIYTKFTSGSVPYLKWLQGMILRLCQARGNIVSSNRAYQLSFGKKASLILFEKMYHSEHIPFLKRKHLKAQKIFKINKHKPRWRNLADAPA